jgi:pimeloyl-ACP methyl ester carboxylesterase
MPFADVNGQHVYFQDSGGDGAAVIFSHGFLMDHEMFDPQVEALSGEFRCITWDERGFGQTDAAGPFSYWDSADDALALLSHLGVQKAFFV